MGHDTFLGYGINSNTLQEIEQFENAATKWDIGGLCTSHLNTN